MDRIYKNFSSHYSFWFWMLSSNEIFAPTLFKNFWTVVMIRSHGNNVIFLCVFFLQQEAGD